MGNREDLLDAAIRCLYEKGWARTTARDVAAAAGVSLAAIGYHYGSKDALLTAALRHALEGWGDDLAGLLAGADGGTTPAERFDLLWTRIVESFADGRALWAVQFELLAHLDRFPELRSQFTTATRHARLGLAELFGFPPDDPRADTIGALLQSLLAGLAAQWLADPATVPSGAELRTAIQAVAGSMPG